MVAKIVTAVVEGATGFLGGIGTGIVDFFQTVVVNSDGDLTAFAGWSLALLGIGFGGSLIAWAKSKVGR